MQKFSAFKGLYVDRPKTNSNSSAPKSDIFSNQDTGNNDTPSEMLTEQPIPIPPSTPNLSHKAKDYLRIIAAHDNIVNQILSVDNTKDKK